MYNKILGCKMSIILVMVEKYFKDIFWLFKKYLHSKSYSNQYKYGDVLGFVNCLKNEMNIIDLN